ncbi:MAG: hypothetical protein GX454_13210 [Brooklawnia sp.]|nr:hypothetical protein [Brooklawnia sp.]
MHPRTFIPEAVRATAAEQARVISFEQAKALGLSVTQLRRYLDEGHWTRLARGIYLVGPTPPDWYSLLWAGALSAGPAAAVAGLAAARLWELTTQEQMPISIVLPHSARARADSSWWEFTRRRSSFRIVGNPPRLSLEQTVLDLCGLEPAQSAHWVTQAVGSRRTTVPRLRAELADLHRHPARRQLTQLLADVGRGAQSPLELVYLRDVERAHGLPAGRRQARSGGYRVDVAYGFGLVVELDGRLGHVGAGAFRDMDRDNFHAMHGVETLRFGWQQCHAEPCRVATMVAVRLQALGWAGEISSCRRCRLVPSRDLLHL